MEKLIDGEPLSQAAMRAGMAENTARRYRILGQLPSECQSEHDWRTRPDPFEEVWEEVRGCWPPTPACRRRRSLPNCSTATRAASRTVNCGHCSAR